MAFGLEEFAERIPDAAAILSHTSAVHRVVNRTDAAMEGIEQTWLRLSQPGVYSVPGDEVVFTALQPARTATSNLVETAIELSEAMASYADEIDSLKARYIDLKARVDSFDAEHPWTEKADWNDDDEAVAEHNVLASESARLLADLDQAQRDTANRIAAIAGSSRRYSEDGNGEEIEYGRSAEDRVAGTGGHMKDGDFWVVDVWEWGGRNRERVRDVRDKVREGFWGTVRDGFIPGLPPFIRRTAPDQSNPNGVGRDPNQPPILKDSDYGDGEWRNVKRQELGAAYQEHITGVVRPDGEHATEYIVPYDGAYYGEVEFDGHYWREGPPPEEVFQESKGRYAWAVFPSPEDKLKNRPIVRSKLDYLIQDEWLGKQMRDQYLAIKDNANAVLEWYVADEIVADKMRELLADNEAMARKIRIIQVDHP